MEDEVMGEFLLAELVDLELSDCAVGEHGIRRHVARSAIDVGKRRMCVVASYMVGCCRCIWQNPARRIKILRKTPFLKRQGLFDTL